MQKKNPQFVKFSDIFSPIVTSCLFFFRYSDGEESQSKDPKDDESNDAYTEADAESTGDDGGALAYGYDDEGDVLLDEDLEECKDEEDDDDDDDDGIDEEMKDFIVPDEEAAGEEEDYDSEQEDEDDVEDEGVLESATPLVKKTIIQQGTLGRKVCSLLHTSRPSER